MIIDLSNKNALIGGASKGIGFAAAYALADAGANVTIMARDKKTIETACKKLPVKHSNQKHHWVSVDNDKPDEMLEKLKTHAAENALAYQILINNTGGPPGGLITEAKPEDFYTALRRHLECNHLLVQWILPEMRKSNYGRIVNIISTSVKEPLPNLGVSNTTRGAVAAWAKTVSKEVAKDGITVNNVLPGATETERLFSILETKAEKSGKALTEVSLEMLKSIPMGRFGKAQEVAALVCFFASPQAAYITGTCVPVDGGRTNSF